jgi:hypothetical protein
MNTIFSASVWCEVHGPVNVFCTQAFEHDQAALSAPSSEAGAGQRPRSVSSSTAAQGSGLAQASGIGSTGTTTTSPPRTKATCASCSFTLPPDLATPNVAPVLKTIEGKHVYVSQRHPSNPERYKILRSSCIRALSGELVPGRSGPIFFGDPSIGYNIATIFRLRDQAAGGSTKRTFCFMCTSTEEQDLLRSYTFITDRFAALVEKLVAASQTASQEAATDASSSLQESNAGGGTVGPSLAPQGFLRTKGRAAACGLPELTGMPDVFVQVHAVFAWLLHAWLQHYEGPIGSETSTADIARQAAPQ